MKNPKSFSNSELIEQLKSLAGEERRLGLEILHFLREVEKCRLYADRYSSLHEFAVKELHYSDGAAYRRIQSMRLLKDLPEVEEEIKSGTLTLSTARTRHRGTENSGDFSLFSRAHPKTRKAQEPACT